jgi:hypothetical protein
MAERRERIFDVHWEGPFKWGEHEDKPDECHVLYAIYQKIGVRSILLA